MRSQTGYIRSSPFYDVYYFADLAIDILRDPVESGVEWSDSMSELAEDVHSIVYPKDTLLHCFLREMVSRSMYERDFAAITAPDLPQYARFQRAVPFEFQRFKLGVERALEIYGLKFDPFEAWPDENGERDDDAFYEWYQELRLTQEFDTLLRNLADEIFTILFSNRQALFFLNDWLTSKIASADKAPVERHAPPMWARRAVFYRDRGRCCTCGTDLSGLLSVNIAPTFDHVVPLVAGGPNDVTNLQLLCAKCNSTKGISQARPTFTYEPWFD